MERPPRPSGEPVITRAMWGGILLSGLTMAAVTLAVLDASLVSGFIHGSGDLRYGQTMAFNTLTLAQFFNVFNARSDLRSAFSRLFANRLLWGAVGLSLVLQFAVIYFPPLQRGFGTVALTINDWLLCLVAASMVLWVREISKLFKRRTRQIHTG